MKTIIINKQLNFFDKKNLIKNMLIASRELYRINIDLKNKKFEFLEVIINSDSKEYFVTMEIKRKKIILNCNIQKHDYNSIDF